MLGERKEEEKEETSLATQTKPPSYSKMKRCWQMVQGEKVNIQSMPSNWGRKRPNERNANLEARHDKTEQENLFLGGARFCCSHSKGAHQTCDRPCVALECERPEIGSDQDEPPEAQRRSTRHRCDASLTIQATSETNDRIIHRRHFFVFWQPQSGQLRKVAAS